MHEIACQERASASGEAQVVEGGGRSCLCYSNKSSLIRVDPGRHFGNTTLIRIWTFLLSDKVKVRARMGKSKVVNVEWFSGIFLGPLAQPKFPIWVGGKFQLPRNLPEGF